MFRRKKSQITMIEINDYLIRGLSITEGDLTSARINEYPLAPGSVVNGVIKDELAFFDTLKEVTKLWNIAKHDVRFFVPDHSVMLRSFQHPVEVTTNSLKGFVEMELGQSIHLPFENPLFDVYDYKENDGEAVIFAAPAEESVKLIQLFEDVDMNPTVLDVRTLSNIRYLSHASLFSSNRTYLLVDWSLHAVFITIYSDGNVDFLRYQPSERTAGTWSYESGDDGESNYTYDGDLNEYRKVMSEQIYEIERILNFYRFSLHKGEKSVDHIVMLGENPEMAYFIEQTKAVIDLPLTVIDKAYVNKKYSQFEAKHVALLGLALKGGASNGS
ncbi:type IV pilus biogenesis protein PilM [Sporosarcina sp. CAU 1771]